MRIERIVFNIALKLYDIKSPSGFIRKFAWRMQEQIFNIPDIEELEKELRFFIECNKEYGTQKEIRIISNIVKNEIKKGT